MAQQAMDIELMNRNSESAMSYTDRGLSKGSHPLEVHGYTTMLSASPPIHQVSTSSSVLPTASSTQLLIVPPALEHDEDVANGPQLSDEIITRISAEDSITNNLMAIFGGCDSQVAMNHLAPSTDNLYGPTYSPSALSLDNDVPSDGFHFRQAISAGRAAQSSPVLDTTRAVQQTIDASTSPSSPYCTTPATITSNSSAAALCDGRVNAISETTNNKATGATPLGQTVIPTTAFAPSEVQTRRFVKSDPAALLLCLVLSFLCFGFQAASTAIYFNAAPTVHDGHLKDPDYLSLVANFCAGTLGIFILLSGINKALQSRDPNVVGWSLVIGVVSFVCAAVALGLYFLHTNLGDLLMTLASLFQIWIWMIMTFKME